jgi:hypothetical protein
MPSNTDPPVRFAVFWILLFGFCVRAQTVRTPLFDHHNWRQADTAQIARNFWRERFNPLFPVRSVSFHSWYEYDPDRLQLCRELQPKRQPRDLVAFVDHPSPDIRFCLDRHGWLFGTGEWTSDDLLRAWTQGASVLVVPDAVPPPLPEAIRSHATLLARSGQLSACRLR